MKNVDYNQKRVVRGLEHAVFGERVCHFVFRNNDFLFQDFYGKQVPRAFFSTKNHFSESAFPKHFDEFKIFQSLFQTEIKQIMSHYLSNLIIHILNHCNKHIPLSFSLNDVDD